MPSASQRLHSKIKTRAVDRENLTVDFVVSTPDKDSYGTRIDQSGWRLDKFKSNPVITWAHDDRGATGSDGLPIANAIPESIRVENGNLVMRMKFTPEDVNPFGYKVFRMIDAGFLHASSVGFDPIREEIVSEDGEMVPWYREQDLLEVAIVTIPSNSKALARRARQLNREDEIDKIRALAAEVEDMAGQQSAHDDPVRWNRRLSRSFDVASKGLKPMTTEYDWVARHIGCQVKQVFRNSMVVPHVRMGLFLSGLKNVLQGSTVDDVRNFAWDDKEMPPVYEVIQLNSRMQDDFLVNGTAFYSRPEMRFAVRFQPSYFGLDVDVFSSLERKDENRALVDRAWQWAEENNFLKGEAFALSGEFLPRTNESWDDAFLEEKNKKALSRLVDLVNQKGKDLPNRGLILTGPPGTGKTLSGRIVRNTADATFIWISSRDFHYSGSIGGLSEGFRLARELSPSVLFIEDVDNWLSPTTVDLLKTELDGVSRSSGVVTVLTTNFPERLPQALIDRPGRFHDVLQFDVPTAEARSAMLRKWVEDLSDQDLAEAVQRTGGYSGAHMYELSSFARTIRDFDGLPIAEALQEAIRKVEEQKDLISKVQLQGSDYRPSRALRGMLSHMDTPHESRSSEQEAAPVPSVEKPVDESSVGTVPVVVPGSKVPAPDGSEPPLPEAIAEMAQKMTAEYVQKCISYFERKQPVNKAASKVLKRFFQIRSENPPADEMDAWDMMGQHLDLLGSHADGLQGKLDDCLGKMRDMQATIDGMTRGNVEDPKDPGNVESPNYTEGEEKNEESRKNVEDPAGKDNVEHSGRATEKVATHTASSTLSLAPEAPAQARKASARLPLALVMKLRDMRAKHLRDQAEEALRHGFPVNRLGEILASESL